MYVGGRVLFGQPHGAGSGFTLLFWSGVESCFAAAFLITLDCSPMIGNLLLMIPKSWQALLLR